VSRKLTCIIATLLAKIVKQITVVGTMDMSLVFSGVSFCQRYSILLWNHLLTNIYERGGLDETKLLSRVKLLSSLSLKSQGYV